MTPAPVHAGSDQGGTVWCIVVAAGSGSRFGSAKQFELLAGELVVSRATATAAQCCDGVVVVQPADSTSPPPVAADIVVAGGATRSASVRAGLGCVPQDARVVLVHDAARPLATEQLFERVIDAVRAGAVAVVPVVDVVDTVRSVDGGVVDRSSLRAVQTPQGFDAATLRRVHAAGGEATDDAGLVEAIGGHVRLVEGERSNLKLTERADLVVAEALLADRDRVGGDSSA